MPETPCQCPGAETCPVHERRMGEADYQLCRTRPEYYEMFARLKGQPVPEAPKQPPAEGVGTELKKLLASLGAEAKVGCPCPGRILLMNAWGVEGCRANVPIIAGWMREGAKKAGATRVIAATLRAVATGLARKLDWRNPFVSLVHEAIRRAEASTNSPSPRVD